MKVDRCRKIELILDDARKIASAEETPMFATKSNKMIRKRIAKLNDEELLSLMKNIVVMEHHFNDVFMGEVTNGDLVSVLKKMAVNNNDNINVYNKAKRLYARYIDKMQSHSLINRTIKVNNVFKELKTMNGLYVTSQKVVDEYTNYGESVKIKKAKKEFYNRAVELNRMLDYFDERELSLLKRKCEKYDQSNKFVDSKLQKMLYYMRDNSVSCEQTMNSINAEVC